MKPRTRTLSFGWLVGVGSPPPGSCHACDPGKRSGSPVLRRPVPSQSGWGYSRSAVSGRRLPRATSPLSPLSIASPTGVQCRQAGRVVSRARVPSPRCLLRYPLPLPTWTLGPRRGSASMVHQTHNVADVRSTHSPPIGQPIPKDIGSCVDQKWAGNSKYYGTEMKAFMHIERILI